jgi:hypothetical protein
MTITALSEVLEGSIACGTSTKVVLLEVTVALLVVLVIAFVLDSCQGVGLFSENFSFSCSLCIEVVVLTPFVDLVCCKNPRARGDLCLLL